MNLYKKLLLAQAPIAIALAIVGIFSVIVVSYLGSHSQTILKDNYRSVLAAQRMKEAIERMDSGALFIVAGERQKGLEQAEKNRPIFEAELKVQEGNITGVGREGIHRGAARRVDGLSNEICAPAKKHEQRRGKTTLLFRAGIGLLQSEIGGRRDPGDQSRHHGAQKRRRAAHGGAHERGHHHGGAGRPCCWVCSSRHF